jgi:DNA-binding transcriptional regulator YiaG
VLDTVSALRQRGRGAVGAYLRKEGVYYSSVHSWESQRSQGRLTARSRGPKEKNREALQGEIKQLRRKLEQTQNRLAKTEMIVDLQKKLSAFMETHSQPETSDAR